MEWFPVRNLEGSVRSRGRTGPLYGGECDLIEAGLNEAAATALSDEKKFKTNGLRQSPDSDTRTTWTLRHGCCFMGESRFLSVCDFKRLGVAKRSPTTTFTLEA
jgi:hypothetical protein